MHVQLRPKRGLGAAVKALAALVVCCTVNGRAAVAALVDVPCLALTAGLVMCICYSCLPRVTTCMRHAVYWVSLQGCARMYPISQQVCMCFMCCVLRLLPLWHPYWSKPALRALSLSSARRCTVRTSPCFACHSCCITFAGRVAALVCVILWCVVYQP